MQQKTEHRIIYLGCGVIFVGLLVWGIVAFEHRSDSQAAQDKADELIQLYRGAGLPVPDDTDQITATLGTDGGQVCATADDDLAQGLYKLNTALNPGSVGSRAVTLDRDVVEGGALIVEVYCPDKLADYLKFVNDDLDTEDGVVDLD